MRNSSFRCIHACFRLKEELLHRAIFINTLFAGMDLSRIPWTVNELYFHREDAGTMYYIFSNPFKMKHSHYESDKSGFRCFSYESTWGVQC